MNLFISRRYVIGFLSAILFCTACTKEAEVPTGRERFVGNWTGFAKEDYKMNGTVVYQYMQGFSLHLKNDGTGFRTLPWMRDTIEWFYQEKPARVALLIPFGLGSPGKYAESFSITKDTDTEQIWFSEGTCDIKDSTNTQTFANRFEKTWQLTK